MLTFSKTTSYCQRTDDFGDIGVSIRVNELMKLIRTNSRSAKQIMFLGVNLSNVSIVKASKSSSAAAEKCLDPAACTRFLFLWHLGVDSIQQRTRVRIHADVIDQHQSPYLPKRSHSLLKQLRIELPPARRQCDCDIESDLTPRERPRESVLAVVQERRGSDRHFGAETCN